MGNAFIDEGLIFAARLLVVIVAKEDLHAKKTEKSFEIPGAHHHSIIIPAKLLCRSVISCVLDVIKYPTLRKPTAPAPNTRPRRFSLRRFT